MHKKLLLAAGLLGLAATAHADDVKLGYINKMGEHPWFVAEVAGAMSNHSAWQQRLLDGLPDRLTALRNRASRRGSRDVELQGNGPLIEPRYQHRPFLIDWYPSCVSTLVGAANVIMD